MAVSEAFIRNEYIYGEREASLAAKERKIMELDIDVSDILKFEINRAIMTQLEINPRTRLVNLDELSIDEIKNYLRTLHVVLFLNWTISDPKGLEDAAQWIKGFLDKLYAFNSTKIKTR